MDSRLVDEDGHEVVVELRPPVPEAEVATLRAGYPVPLPAELVRLLAVTSRRRRRCSTSTSPAATTRSSSPS